ncbi:MAG: DUF2807 domain-containing protein [Bacteroidia bacterium]|nr:DUF2807 domain-containing protein [Bacteroidia bacterium]
MKLKIYFISALVTIVLFISGSCRVFCTEGNGLVQTEKRELTNCNSFVLDLPANVRVLKGSATSVVIEAQENLLTKIKTHVSGNALKINSDGCISSDEKILLTVYLPELEGIAINGSGNISIPDTFIVQHLKLEINGSGDINGKFVAAKVKAEINGSGSITLSGSADKQDVEILGSGNIQTQSLICNSADIAVKGSGDVYVYAIKNLDVEVAGSGTVHYKGKPQVNSKVTGSGKVVDEN